MAKKLSQKIVAIVLIVVAIALIAAGIYGVNLRASAQGQRYLADMRARAVLSATGESAVEAYVAIAKKEATAQAKAAGGGMSAIREAVAKAEEEARANYSGNLVDYATVDTAELNEALDGMASALKDYSDEEAAAIAEYAATVAASKEAASVEAPVEVAPDAAQAPAADAEMSVDDLSLETEQEPQIDLSGFVATERMNELRAVADEKYVNVGAALQNVYPGLDDAAVATLKDTVELVIYQSGDDYAVRYDRFADNGGAGALGSDLTMSRVARYGDDLITIGIGVIILALLILFYQSLIKKLGLPRMIIGLFFVLLCVLAVLYDLSITNLMSSAIVRMGMNSILVLAMVPGIQCGISLNLGLPVGIMGGLIGGLLCIELGYSGWLGFLFSVVVGVAIAAVCGYLYSLLLNRLKGSEMAVTTYVGFSIVSLMCIAWLVLPFTSLELRWPLGTGLRNTLSMDSSYKQLLNNFWSFSIGDFFVPTGLLLFMALSCFLVWLFLRSKTGVAMSAVGNNPRFAEATGINVDKMRIIGTVLSTVLGAIGIIVYNQSYGFMQLYTAPRQMGFIAASAILIGGASTSRCKISHVIIGTFLFQGVLTLGMPVANVLVPQSTISETIRILISNGIILYALTKSGGESRA